MSKHKYDAVATIGEYTNHQGETKKRYTKIGAVFENDEGNLSLKLDSVPVGPNWTGWISFYEPRDNRQPPAPRSQAEVDKKWAKEDAEAGDEIPY